MEKKREEKEEKKAMKEMKRAEAAAKVDENIKRKKTTRWQPLMKQPTIWMSATMTLNTRNTKEALIGQR